LVSKIKQDKLTKIIHKIEEATILLENLKTKKFITHLRKNSNNFTRAVIEEEILQEEQNTKKKPQEDDEEEKKVEEKVIENTDIKEEDIEIFKRTSRKIKTIYMKTKKLI